MMIYYGPHLLMLLMIYCWYLACVCSALSCFDFSKEYGEAMLSRLLMRSREVGNAQSVQQTTDIFLTLPPALPGEKKCQGVLTQKSVDKYTFTHKNP